MDMRRLPPLPRPLTLFFLLATLAFWPAGQAWAQNLQGPTEATLQAADLGSAQVGVCVIDLQTGQTLVELLADTPLIPASNMKLVTTAAALHVLGPDFVFKTDLRFIDGDAAAGLDGHQGADPVLLIVGDGDPAFGDPDLLAQHGLSFDQLIDRWVDAVVEAGVARYETLLIDDRVFDRDFVHRSWPTDQLNRWYCAQVAGLNFHDNVLHVLPQPASAASLTAVVDVFPDMPFLQIRNRITTGREHRVGFERTPGTNRYDFFGTVRDRATRPWKVTVHDPPMLLGELLRYELAQAGVSVGTVRRVGGDEAVPPSALLHRVQTALPPVLNRTNRDSMNLFADALFKRMGYAVTGTPGSRATGAAAIRTALQQTLGPSAAVVQVADGSGMSRDNRVTARVLAGLLANAWQDPDTAELFVSSLARAGRTPDGRDVSVGNFDGRFTRLTPGSYVYGKSGYINSVSSLSGFLVRPGEPTVDGSEPEPRLYAFSVLVNGYAGHAAPADVKRLLDRIVEAWDDALQPAPATN